MFNRKRIKRLEENLDSLSESYRLLYNHFNNLQWKFDNSPKYKTGNNIKPFGKITKVYYLRGCSEHPQDWFYQLFDCKAKVCWTIREGEIQNKIKEYE